MCRPQLCGDSAQFQLNLSANHCLLESLAWSFPLSIPFISQLSHKLRLSSLERRPTFTKLKEAAVATLGFGPPGSYYETQNLELELVTLGGPTAEGWQEL